MTLHNGYKQYLQDWYDFYKSINTRNNNNKWLIDIALEHLEKKMMECDVDNRCIEHHEDDFIASNNIIPSVYSNTDNITHNNFV